MSPFAVDVIGTKIMILLGNGIVLKNKQIKENYMIRKTIC